MHSVHHVTCLADPLAWMAVAGLALVCILGFRLRRSNPVIMLGLIWFLAVLAPSSSFLPLREGMAEHRVYLASAGLFMAGASFVQRWAVRGRDRSIYPRFAIAAVVAVLCLLTVMRNRVWADPVALWSEATLHAEDMWEPHYALADSPRVSVSAAAVPEYQRSWPSPPHRDGHTNLGIARPNGAARRGRARVPSGFDHRSCVRAGFTNLRARVVPGTGEGPRLLS
jgi:hypothetical protein